MTVYIGIACIAGAIAVVVYALVNATPEQAPVLGLRGFKRQRALAGGGLFSLFEPAVRKIGGWMALLPLRQARRRATHRLAAAGDFLGLTPNEYLALHCLCGFVGLGVGAVIVTGVGLTPVVALLVAAFGAWIPYSLVVNEANCRRSSIERELPATIELMALCMSAGIDFPGAIRQVTADHGLEETPLREELRRILRELELGHSRRRALLAFALRVPSDAVRDLVAAVVQSEDKGNPLRDVLRIQASVLRTRRSIVAEEAAARASVAMIGPLVMLLSATVLLIAGPLFIKTVLTTGGGF